MAPVWRAEGWEAGVFQRTYTPTANVQGCAASQAIVPLRTAVASVTWANVGPVTEVAVAVLGLIADTGSIALVFRVGCVAVVQTGPAEPREPRGKAFVK